MKHSDHSPLILLPGGLQQTHAVNSWSTILFWCIFQVRGRLKKIIQISTNICVCKGGGGGGIKRQTNLQNTTSVENCYQIYDLVLNNILVQDLTISDRWQFLLILSQKKVMNQYQGMHHAPCTACKYFISSLSFLH